MKILDMYKQPDSNAIAIHTTKGYHRITITKVLLCFSIPGWTEREYKAAQWSSFKGTCLFTNTEVLYTKMFVDVQELNEQTRKLLSSHPKTRIYNQHHILTLLMMDCPALRLWNDVEIANNKDEHRGTYVWYTGCVVRKLSEPQEPMPLRTLYLHVQTETPTKRSLPVASWKRNAWKYNMDPYECCEWDIQRISSIHAVGHDFKLIFEHSDEKMLLKSFRNWFAHQSYEILLVWDYETGLDYLDERWSELDLPGTFATDRGAPRLQCNGKLHYLSPGGTAYISLSHMLMTKGKLPPHFTPGAIASRMGESNLALALKKHSDLCGALAWLRAFCNMNTCTHRNAFDSYWMHWLTLLLNENRNMLHRTHPIPFIRDTSSGGVCYDVKTHTIQSNTWKMDIVSCYTSIIREYQLCYTTVSERRLHEDDLEFLLSPTKDAPKKRVYVSRRTNGAVIPKLIEKGILKREELKNLLAQKKEIGEEDESLDAQQQGLKIHNNRFYGLLHSSTIFANTIFARLIASLGQEHIGALRQIAESLGASLVAGDTDCVMLQCSKDVAHKVYEEFNKKYAHIKVCKPELFERIYFVSKKNYAAILNGTIVEKGLPGMSILHPIAIHEVARYVFSKLFADHVDREQVEKEAKERIAQMQDHQWIPQSRPQKMRFLQVSKSAEDYKKDAALIVQNILDAYVKARI